MTFVVKHARRLAKDHDLQAVVVLTVARDGVVTVTTYGEDTKKCNAIGEWGQGLWKYAVSVVPFQTVFGMNNGGIPKRVTQEQQKVHDLEQAIQRNAGQGVAAQLDDARAQAQG
jgi:hypothetical protein